MNANNIETMGILGGGQLGRMMCLAAKYMGYRVMVLDPAADCPAGQVSDKLIAAPYDDVAALHLLLQQCDVVTYEFENVPLKAAQLLEAKLPQSSRLLEITQNRILEKAAVRNLGLATVPYTPITSPDDLTSFGDIYVQEPYRLIVKTALGGYDGKGQYVIENTEDWNAFVKDHYRADRHYVAETAVVFDKELSVIVCRNASGDMNVFPVAENIHRNQILHKSIVPARIEPDLKERIAAMAQQLAGGLNLVGTLAIELFLVGDDILVNELAPRPHNSGHYTLDACTTSQFEQHIRAICNLPLGEVRLFSPVVMLNILGEDMAFLNRKKVGVHKLHLYGKTDSREGRKMGHINILADNLDECITISETIL
jgi:5-(carboxyamino)imidazole ribonucleotide synthase